MSRRLASRPGAGLATAVLTALALGLSALTAAAPHLHRHLGGWVLIGAFSVTAAGASAAYHLGARTGHRRAVWIILAGAVGMRAALLGSDPYLSSDIYRYIWDGRVEAAGVNPYRYVPAAPELASLRDQHIFPNINRADYAPTIYPPVAQWIFFGVTRLGESVLAMKLALVAFEAITIATIAMLLRQEGAPLTRLAIYAWHPLAVWEIAGNGHIDAAMIALLMLAVLAYARGRTLVAGVVATLGALIKPTALLALPVFWRPRDWRMVVAVLTTLLLAYLPYSALGFGTLGFMAGYVHEEGLTTGSGYNVIWLLQNLAGPLPYVASFYILCALLLLIFLSLAAGFRRDRSLPAALRSMNWLLLVFLVLSSPHYPWYFLVLVPFLALRPTVTAWVLTVASVLFYNAVPEVGPLPSYEARIAVFTALTLMGLAYDVLAERQKPAPVPLGEAS
jgi:hypothetical protein